MGFAVAFFFQADRLQRQPLATNFFVSLSTSSIILYMKRKKKSEECISATDRNNEFRVFRDEMLCSPQCIKIEEKGTPKNDEIFEIFLGPKNTL